MLHTVGYTESEKYRALDNLQKGMIDLCLIYCGWEQCDPGHRFGPNRRLSNILHIVDSGEGFSEMNDQKFYLKSGDAFLIPAGREAWYEADKEHPWAYRWIGFEGMDASQLLPENNLLRSGLLQILFGEMAANYSRRLMINELASRIGVNRSYLTTNFKKCMGCSPQEYLINVRVERAKSLLQKTDIQINEVAAKVGYPDPLAFSKIFKRKTGYSPTEYKEARSRLVLRNVKGEYIGIHL